MYAYAREVGGTQRAEQVEAGLRDAVAIVFESGGRARLLHLRLLGGAEQGRGLFFFVTTAKETAPVDTRQTQKNSRDRGQIRSDHTRLQKNSSKNFSRHVASAPM